MPLTMATPPRLPSPIYAAAWASAQRGGAQLGLRRLFERHQERTAVSVSGPTASTP